MSICLELQRTQDEIESSVGRSPHPLDISLKNLKRLGNIPEVTHLPGRASVDINMDSQGFQCKGEYMGGE